MLGLILSADFFNLEYDNAPRGHVVATVLMPSADPVGLGRCDRNRLMCVPQRLARSAGDRPAEERARTS